MSVHRNKQISELFHGALECPEDERAGYLLRACDDEEVREEVRSLLAADTGAEAFLHSPLRSDAIIESASAPDAMIGRRIGEYTVRRLIGSGGMGVVYEVQQAHPRRTIALKLMRSGFADAARIRRFKHEIDVLGRLHHPGIAQVFDAGVHREVGVDVPYFAMEYVAAGCDIITFARERDLDCRSKLELFAKVCDAVGHGHQRGVIHRDLKPSNVLVDAVGQPKVIDFGVARLIDAEGEGAVLQTKTGELVGTLRYMSPEQCQSASRDVDTRTDVYSLGVILYELITGAFPYEVDTLSSMEVPRVICEVEPRKPSSIDRALRGDAETIVLKALAKDPRRRYASVGDLASDIRRFLNHRAIDARRDSGWYVVRMTLRQYWITAAVISLFVVLCAASALSFGVLYRRAGIEHGKTVEALEFAEQRGYFNSIALAQAALKAGDAQQLLQYLDNCPLALRRWEWFYLRRLADTSLRTFDGGPSCAIVADGARILSFSSADGVVHILNSATGQDIRTYRCDHNVLRCAALSPDQRLLVTGGDDRMVRFWDTATGDAITEAKGDSVRVVSLAFSPDGSRVVSGGFDHGVKMWNPETGELMATVADADSAVAATFSPDGRLLACVTDDGRLLLWDLEAQSMIRSIEAHHAPMLQPAFTSDGGVVVTAASDTRIKLWQVSTGNLLRTIECGTQIPKAIAISPDNTRLAVAAQTVRVWSLQTGTEQRLRLGHVGAVMSVAFSPNGERILSGAADHALKWWDARAPQEPRLLRGHLDFVRAVEVFPDGRRLVSTGRDGTIRIWDVVSGDQIGQFEGHGPVDQELAIVPDGTVIVSGGSDGRIRIHDVGTGETVRIIEPGHTSVGGVAVSPDGREIASVGSDGVCRFWNLADGTQRAEIDFASGPLAHIAYSNTDDRFLVCGQGGTLLLCDRRTLSHVPLSVGHDVALLQATFSPDDRWVAAACVDGAVRIWDVEDRALRHTLRGHGRVAQSVAFLPDGSRLISGGYDHVINIWDPASGALALSLRGHRGGVPWLAVSPQGSWFASASNDNTIGLWFSR